MEEWRNYNDTYQVSNEGNVRSLDMQITQKDRFGNYFTYIKKGRILKQCEDKDGYLVLALGSKNKNKKIHRLVAKLFIPNPNNYQEIDHINGNNKDNRVENLRWVDRKGNMNNAITKKRIAGTKNKKAVLQLDINNNIISEYESLHEMNRQTGYSRWAVSEVIKGNMKTYKGYKWKYK